MIQANGLKKEEQNKIIGLCKAILPDCTIWLYGSRARGDFRANSDIDLALDCKRVIDLMELSELKEVFNATNIFLKVDIVDLASIKDQNFLKSILKERVLWKD
jgi:predicted nucleotidyltransferase